MKSYTLAIFLMIAVQANANPIQVGQNQDAETVEAINREIQDIGLSTMLSLMQAFPGLDLNAIRNYQLKYDEALDKAWNEDIVKGAFGGVDWSPVLKSILELVRSAKTPISQINWKGFKNAMERMVVAECKNHPFMPESQDQNMVRLTSIFLCNFYI